MRWFQPVRADGGEVEDDENEDAPEEWRPIGAVSGEYGDFCWVIETNAAGDLRRRHVRIHGLPRADNDNQRGRFD